MLVKISNHLRADLEREQTTIRFSIAFACLLLYSVLFYNETTVILSLLYLTVSTVYYGFVRLNAHHKAAGKIVMLSADIGFLTSALYLGDLNSLMLYPLFLWAILGNTISFGTDALFRISIITALCFSLGTLQNPAWQYYEILSYSLTLSLIVLPFTYFSLIRHLRQKNNNLDAMIDKKRVEIQKNFVTDSLTGIQNRLALEHEIQKNQKLSIILIDIAKFQHYNDLYSIEAGNSILQKFAQFLNQYSRDGAYSIYRIYGDGFVLKSNQTDISEAQMVSDVKHLIQTITAEKFDIKIEDTIFKIDLSVTVGITVSADKPLENASTALQHAKKHHKSFALYTEELNKTQKLKELLYWGHEIKTAIAEERIIPVFQPIVNAQGQVLKYESLMRIKQINDGDVKLISPFFFLDAAVNTNQYEALTHIMIEKSFHIMSDRQSDFSLNLSSSDINNKETMSFLEQMIVHYNIGSRLTLEILESEDISDYEKIKKFITKFRKLGVTIAIDDFGAGFSNFAHILGIFPDYLKIDGSLIKNIDTDHNAFKLVNSVVTLASSLGIKTVAEFVHSKEVFTITKQLKIDAFQGYLFDAPLTSEQLEEQVYETLT